MCDVPDPDNYLKRRVGWYAAEMTAQAMRCRALSLRPGDSDAIPWPPVIDRLLFEE